MTIKQVLIVDDEADLCDLIAITLARMGIKSKSAENLSQAIELLNQQDFFLCLTDMKLPDGDGIELVQYVQTNRPELPIAVITAFGSVDNAVKMLKAGAFDYVSKPVDIKMLKELINTAYQLVNSVQNDATDEMIGASPIINQLKQDIKKLARSQAPVFIHGHSGVGKELVAQLIHKQGARCNKPFIPVNCGAIPAELMESEFFGHQKGSFTGAIQDKQGLFFAANGGTLFLDEVAELSCTMQVKLLRAIQEKAIKPIGAQQEISVDVRILSASHKNLLDEIQANRFRQDLYYRINVIEIRVPTLKERRGDIPLLVKNILSKLARAQGSLTPVVDECAMDALAHYDYPGNVRELENILERAVAMNEGGMITLADLQLPQLKNKLNVDNLESNTNLDVLLFETERDLIVKALEKTKWNRTAAAKLLGISFRALRYRLRKLNIG